MITNTDAKTGRALARLALVSPPTIFSSLEDLVKEGILTKTIVGKSHTFKINQKNWLVKNTLIPLFRAEKNLIPAFGKFLSDHLDKKNIETIFMYGSLAKGKPQWNLVFIPII